MFVSCCFFFYWKALLMYFCVYVCCDDGCLWPFCPKPNHQWWPKIQECKLFLTGSPNKASWPYKVHQVWYFVHVQLSIHITHMHTIHKVMHRTVDLQDKTHSICVHATQEHWNTKGCPIVLQSGTHFQCLKKKWTNAIEI